MLLESKFTKIKNQLYLIAWLVVAIPFLIGIILSILWLCCDSKILEASMTLTLAVFTNALFVGLLFTIFYYIICRKEKRAIKKVGKLLGFYIFSLVATVVLFIQVYNKATTSTITIENQSSYYIKNAYLVGTHTEKINLAPIKPKSTKIITTNFMGDDSIQYVIVIDTKQSKGILFGYVTSGISNNGWITIYPDKSVYAADSLESDSPGKVSSKYILKFDDWNKIDRNNGLFFKKALLDFDN